MIITIGREYGSGGHDIGEKLAEKLGVELYDKEYLAERLKELGDYEEVQTFFEEKPANSLLYAIAREEADDRLSRKPFEEIRRLIGTRPCVLVGRCANAIFRQQEDHISVFVHADLDWRIQRIAQSNGISEKATKVLIQETDRGRAEFHRQYTGEEWGDSRGYQLSLDSGRIGIQQAAELILAYGEASWRWKEDNKGI
ncbi:cytidylate kinase-like family protein [Aminipila butyrica]|uniref:Cytidylate kinase-like family protein n=1 Tax=Aminipila butyrica TaxID=433296 RepID=A0A858BX97_9FIRM|nr:cytidylate kinase-like family protein [Aminipila butyrica]QIB70573.1 cytidylate kinase-like family protein [Aminipila butyrica]